MIAWWLDLPIMRFNLYFAHYILFSPLILWLFPATNPTAMIFWILIVRLYAINSIPNMEGFNSAIQNFS